MKLLVLVSSLDLTQPYSATPAWWQLLKGLYELGVDIIAAPYQGVPVESLWWRCADNPARWQGDAFRSLRGFVRRWRRATPGEVVRESLSDRAVRGAARAFIAPLWRRHLEAILKRNPDIDALLFLTVPLNHLVGVPGYLSQKYDLPIFYFDGDVPASLPNMQGFASGFRIYQGADVKEYTAFISNSTGGEALLRQLGVEHVHTLWYGADPEVFSPAPVAAQDIDVFFYGHGREYRSEWIDRMIKAPSSNLTDARFAVRGSNLGDIGNSEALPYLSFSKLREYVCRSKLNLCITRGAHASVYGSSSSRPFELAAMSACVVANPYLGLETWLEPEKEIIIVASVEEATERYRFLLSHDSDRESIGRAARARVLKQHTYRHRARELLAILGQYM
ncbi:MAG: glycosyltransferase [Chloroflexi bacterium]|nr:glycosyltransferase [Chloroflexota bacterium]